MYVLFAVLILLDLSPTEGQEETEPGLDDLALLGLDTAAVILDPALGGALSSMELGDYASAAAELNDILLEQAGHPQALRLLASCYLHLDDLEQSIQTCQQIAAIDTLDSGVLVGLGYLYQRAGDADNAQLYYTLAEQRAPTDPYPLFGKAWLYVVRHELEAAHELATQITELAPSFAENYILLGRVLTSKGFYREAARSYRQAFELKPSLRSSYGVLLQELSLRHGARR